MLRWIARRRLAAFENAFSYDASYLRDILDINLPLFLRFSQAAKMAQHCDEVPLDAWHAAKIASLIEEDCGPCTQLAVAMAESAGVDQGILRGILEGDEPAMGPDAVLSWRFTRAALAHDPQADALRKQVLARWGKRGLLSLALVMSVSRLFPSMKVALGHGHACSRIRIGDIETRPRRVVPA